MNPPRYRKAQNYWTNPDMTRANSMIRQAACQKDPTIMERARAFRDQVMAHTAGRYRAWRDLRAGRLEKIRGACLRGDQSAAWAILKDLMGLDAASDDTKRKAARCFASRFPTAV